MTNDLTSNDVLCTIIKLMKNSSRQTQEIITMSVVVYNDESSINPLKANVLYRTVRANEYFYEERKKNRSTINKRKRV